MKNYINTITEGDCLLNTLGPGVAISATIDITPETITAYDDEDIAVLDTAGFLDISLKYKQQRAEAYPSQGDQNDMAYWDRKNGTTTLDDAITAVKAAYPKEVIL